MSPKKAGAEKEDPVVDAPHQDDGKDSRKEDRKDDQKQASKDNKKDDEKPVNKLSQKDSHKDGHKDVQHDAQSAASKESKDDPKATSVTSARRPSTADIVKKLILRRQSEGLLFDPQSRRHSLAAPELLAPSTQQYYAPWDATGGVPPESDPDRHDGAKASFSFPYSTIGTCSCHYACNCRKPCKCEPPPCPCKGPIVTSIGGAGSGGVVTTMVPIPVPFPVPGYNEGHSSGHKHSGSKGSHEPIVINPYPPATSTAHHVPTTPTRHPPDPHGRSPTSVDELTSLMKTVMINRIRDDLLKQWGVQDPTSASNAHHSVATTAGPEGWSRISAVYPEAVPGPSRMAHRTGSFHRPARRRRSHATEREDHDPEHPPRSTANERQQSAAPRILKPLGRGIP